MGRAINQYLAVLYGKYKLAVSKVGNCFFEEWTKMNESEICTKIRDCSQSYLKSQWSPEKIMGSWRFHFLFWLQLNEFRSVQFPINIEKQRKILKLINFLFFFVSYQMVNA